MHRDVKPLNIVINPETKELRLIDWGLAEFYHANTEYNVRVASRYYKGPELLVDDRFYHYSLDIWSTGCTMASMIFRRDTFFKGTDNYDQLVKIMRVLGESELYKYTRKYGLTIPREVRKLISGMEFPRVPFTAFINGRNKSLATEDAIDLLSKMLVYDKNLRIRPKDALKHRYFDPVRHQVEPIVMKAK